MSVKKDASGRRYVQAETEVPGTPEEVFQAIATGPGLSAWFVPAKVEEREGGKAILNFGPGMDSISTVTGWDPPRRFAAESQNDLGPNGPPVATEWTVEARSGGTCIVRVVHSWFASTDDWDNQFEGHEQGWPAFFRILRLYLTHFPGQRSAALQFIPMSPEPKAKAWAALVGPLGLTGLTAGQRVSSTAGSPPLAGVVERVGESDYPEELLFRTEEPAPGLAHLFAIEMGGQVCLSVRFYFYGDGAAAAVERAEPRWREWINERFPVGDQVTS